jgi:hypothetical protein
MNRTHIIIVCLLLTSLIAPSMLCLIPGAELTPAEMECCRQMTTDCSDIQLVRSCCCTLEPSDVLRAVIPAEFQKPSIGATTAALIVPDFAPGLQEYDEQIGLIKFRPPLRISPQAANVLRI